MIRDKPLRCRPFAAQRSARIRIDWRASFRAFSELHGGDPVTWKGRLLWRDGWGHSATDYRGPEFPPPSDPREAAKLRRRYWLIRLALAKRAEKALGYELEGFDELARSRSAPLFRRVVTRDDDGVARLGSAELDLSEGRERLAWLREQVEECVERLEEGKSNGKEQADEE